MHDIHIYHRDIKGLNVFMTKQKICKVGDFGISKINENPFMETIVGTPMFLPPEMIKR